MSFLDSLGRQRQFERPYAEYLVSRFQSSLLPGGARVDWSQEYIPRRGFQEALVSSASKPVLLVGEPGAGKTSTLEHLALANARVLAHDAATALVPIFISCRVLDRLPGLGDLRGLLLAGDLAARCPEVYFADAVAAGRAIVLLDDVDALSIPAVESVRQVFGNARVVAASRGSLPGFVEYRMPALRDHAVAAFARAWNAQNASAFLAALKASRVPRRLTGLPMTLALLTRGWKAGQPLPATRTGLFDLFAQVALDGSAAAAQALEEAALETLDGRVASNPPPAQSRGFVRAGKNRAAEFVHELWTGYFAARGLRRLGDRGRVERVLADPRWQEALVFYAGGGDATEWVDALHARGDVYLAGRLLAHAGQVSAEARETVTRQLIERAWNGDRRAIGVLSEMGSDDAVEWFARQLKSADAPTRARAAEILGELGQDKGVDSLLPLLRDPDPDVRDKAVEALGRAPTDRVVEPLLVALRGDAHFGRVDTRLRVAASGALGAVGSDRAVPALIVDMQHGDPELRAAAARALRQISSPLLLEPLRSIVESGDDEARRHAADILSVLESRV